MFCCFGFTRRSHTPPPPPGEQTPLVKIEPAHLRYQTLIGIPYAHVLRDDKIPMESSTVDELSNSAIFFLSNDTISEKGYDTDNLPCFSLDDADVNAPVVLATRTDTGHILLERVYKIENVTAINNSANLRTHPLSSNTVAMARPFDEFASDSNTSADAPDLPSDNTTKSD